MEQHMMHKANITVRQIYQTVMRESVVGQKIVSAK
jgi:hypothetical protein